MFCASSRHLPSVALREHGVVVFGGDKGGLLKTTDSDVRPGAGPRMQQRGETLKTKQAKKKIKLHPMQAQGLHQTGPYWLTSSFEKRLRPLVSG
jgi:hypothetical protein